MVRVHNCYDPVENLYYSADLEPICIYCSSEDIETPVQEGPWLSTVSRMLGQTTNF